MSPRIPDDVVAGAVVDAFPVASIVDLPLDTLDDLGALYAERIGIELVDEMPDPHDAVHGVNAADGSEHTTIHGEL